MRQLLLTLLASGYGEFCAAAHALPLAQQYDTGASLIDLDSPSYHENFFDFVTRPDINAPRWDVKVGFIVGARPGFVGSRELITGQTHEPERLASGYWFVATYEFIEQEEHDNRSYFGPYIYDQAGELVWSGASLFEGYNVIDFKVSSINGVDMLTGIYSRKSYEVVLNSSYEITTLVPVEAGTFTNIHEFKTVNEGTRSLAMAQIVAPATKSQLNSLGCTSKDVEMLYQGIEERDTTTWELTFKWSSRDFIHLSESLAELQCSDMIDYLHANSIDKFPDGDFLLSGRFTDTLYKISHIDGSIQWRLGGLLSDFDQGDVQFFGQHDAQVHSQNSTTIVLSLLDNAYRPPRHWRGDRSRGKIIALNTERMTAKILQVYDHPRGEGSFADGRGNLQLLDNGNVFAGWWQNSLISEHSRDGQLLLEASWRPPLKSYRSFKFEWIGNPSQPPDVRAMRVLGEATHTLVYVSWNGATEVDRWLVHEASRDRRLLVEAKRKHFETRLTYHGYVKYIKVVAVDTSDNVLGESPEIEVMEIRARLTTQQACLSSILPAADLHSCFHVVICAALLYLLRRRKWRSCYKT